MIDGLLVVDKPAGCTSHDVVGRIRRAAGQRRVGHAGTLDPDATGVLLVGLGRATRLLRFLQDQGKAYRAAIVFGVATDTLDAGGSVVERTPMPISSADLEAVVGRFSGEIDQVPPMVSAVQVGGRRLHQLARAGIEVVRAPRRVRIDRFEIEAFEPGPNPVATVVVECGSGTYIRSLAADVGAALGGCAHLAWLRRLRAGSFTLDEAQGLDTIEANLAADPARVVLGPAVAVRDLASITLDPEQARAVTHGVVFPAPVLAPGRDRLPGPFALLDAHGELVAVYERRGDALKPSVVVAPVEVV